MLAPGMMLAFDGALEVVWASVGYACGWVRSYIQDDIYVRSSCAWWNHAVRKALEDQIKPNDIVAVCHKRTKLSLGNQVEFLRDIQKFVTSRGAKLLLIGDVPQLPDRSLHCIPSTFAPNRARHCEISSDTVAKDDVSHARESAVYRELAREKSTFFFDTFPLLCDPNSHVCGAFVPGTSTLAFIDDDHLTSAGSFYLWPYLCSFLRENGLIDP